MILEASIIKIPRRSLWTTRILSSTNGEQGKDQRIYDSPSEFYLAARQRTRDRGETMLTLDGIRILNPSPEFTRAVREDSSGP